MTEIEIRNISIKAADQHKILYKESWGNLNLTPKEGVVEANYSGYISGYEAAYKKFAPEVNRIKELIEREYRIEARASYFRGSNQNYTEQEVENLVDVDWIEYKKENNL